jgi:hypothetical protein
MNYLPQVGLPPKNPILIFCKTPCKICTDALHGEFVEYIDKGSNLDEYREIAKEYDTFPDVFFVHDIPDEPGHKLKCYMPNVDMIYFPVDWIRYLVARLYLEEITPEQVVQWGCYSAP